MYTMISLINVENILSFSQKIEDYFLKMRIFTSNGENQQFGVNNFHFDKKCSGFGEKDHNLLLSYQL